jgi:DNA-binding transcriptional MocR family regulator
MPQLNIDLASNASLVEQVVAGMRELIDKKILRAGSKATSIRLFASQHHISPHTVSEAYERLVALGYLESRPRSGFFIRTPHSARSKSSPSKPFEEAFDYLWQVRSQLTDDGSALNVSSGKLPLNWSDSELIRASLKSLAAKSDSALNNYGDPFGYLPLRMLLQIKLGDLGILPELDEVLITAGASQAIDLLIRYLLRRGDRVMVDDPGYFNLFSNLQAHGVEALPVTRNTDGPDLDLVEKYAQQHHPAVMFTQSVLHTPTGTTTSPGVAHRLLRLAEQYDFRIIENDAYADMLSSPVTRLATLDQLSRVIYVGSYSKTLSASMRVGFVAAEKGLVRNLANLKMISSITSGQLNERLVYHALTEGHYRRSLERLRARLATEMQGTLGNLEKFGFIVYCRPLGGKFIWTRHPDYADSEDICRAAAESNLVIAPGKVFRTGLRPTPWFRINVGYGNEPALTTLLASLNKK